MGLLSNEISGKLSKKEIAMEDRCQEKQTFLSWREMALDFCANNPR